jgi:hypothetical protein
MPISITTPAAIERSTYAIEASFFDEAGAAVAPNNGLTWTLTDGRGNVINGRSAVSISAAVTVTVVLHGADLALGAWGPLDTGHRFLTFQGTYNSSLGTNLELREQVQFVIGNLVGVT